MHLSVVPGRGQVTVAWGYSNLGSTSETARVAYGPLIGRWSSSRAIGHFYDLASQVYAAGKNSMYPELAVAPNGEVLAVWSACKSSTATSCGYGRRAGSGGRGVVVRWRAPGHGFGVPQVLRTAPLGALAQVDARGTTYLSSGCSGRVLIVPAHNHRFSRSVVVATKQVLDFTLSLAGAGRGLAAWVAGACSTDPEAVGNTPGPVFLSVLHASAFAKPVALTPGTTQAVYANAVALATGGTVSWSVPEPTGYSSVFSAQIGPGGLPGETQQISGGVTVLTADGGGDLVFGPYRGPGGPASPPSAVFVRPAGGGPDQPAPAAAGEVVAAPFGRAVAMAWYVNSGTLELSVWRP